MYKTLTKYGQPMAFGLGIIVMILFLVPVFGGISDFNTLSIEAQKESTIFDLGLKLGIALVAIAAIAALVGGLYHSASNPKGSLKGIIGLVAILALFGVAYSTAGADPAWMGETLREFEVSESQSKIISGAIVAALGMISIAGLAFVGSELRNFFK